MELQTFIRLIKTGEKPKFMVLFCPDSCLKRTYIDLFVNAHHGKPVYRESLEGSKQPRQIGVKPVYVVVDWDQGLKKPSHKYMNVSAPTLLFYTKKGEPSSAVLEAYGDYVTVVPPVTGEQVTNILLRDAIPEPIIEFFKGHTDNVSEALLLGKQLSELAPELNMDISACFDTYFKPHLINRNQDEEPTEFLESIANRDYKTTFSYLAGQRGNELFVYAAVLNWLEDIIKYCSCTGDYWNDAGLVAAKYNVFKRANYARIPFLKLIHLYGEGVRSMQSIKLNESDPATALEAFVICVIQTLT